MILLLLTIASKKKMKVESYLCIGPDSIGTAKIAVKLLHIRRVITRAVSFFCVNKAEKLH